VSGGRVTVWAAGFVVAAGAGAATAHGLFQVARAATVPAGIAWLYPLITDGLALVAYVATTRLPGHGRVYARAVVVLAAAVSGIAQASYLAEGVATAAPELRFVIGAWPAIAAALVAHLLFLIGATHRPETESATQTVTVTDTAIDDSIPDETRNQQILLSTNHEHIHGMDGPHNSRDVQVDSRGARPGVQVDLSGGGRYESESGVPRRLVQGVPGVPLDHGWGVPGVPSGTRGDVRVDHESGLPPFQVERWNGLRPALAPGDRAVALAELHRRRSGVLPSVRELAALAEVGQGTAARVLQELRDRPPSLHVVSDDDESSTQS
jgi:hypothetical protein